MHTGDWEVEILEGALLGEDMPLQVAVPGELADNDGILLAKTLKHESVVAQKGILLLFCPDFGGYCLKHLVLELWT